MLIDQEKKQYCRWDSISHICIIIHYPPLSTFGTGHDDSPALLMSELVLHEAAASGDYHELQSLLLMGKIDVNHKDVEFGERTALHWAAAKGI